MTAELLHQAKLALLVCHLHCPGRELPLTTASAWHESNGMVGRSEKARIWAGFGRIL